SQARHCHPTLPARVDEGDDKGSFTLVKPTTGSTSIEPIPDPSRPQADVDHSSHLRQACLLRRRRFHLHPPPISSAPNYFVVVAGKAWIGRSRPSITRAACRCNASARCEPDATACIARDDAYARLPIACIAFCPRPLSPVHRPLSATAITARPSLPFASAAA
ncbi:hypothetical protein ACLOJK_006905, partial [Asimina triloba]